MRRRFKSILGVLLATLLLQPGNPTSGGSDADNPDRLHRAIREATCAEASATAMADKLVGTSISDVRISESGGRALFYVSPDGEDNWSGRLPAANAQRSDGPFASIEKARDTARKTGSPSTIAIGGGDYYLPEAIEFDARDTGLVITARCGETPILHGGTLVTEWTPQGGGRWRAPLKLPAGQQLGDLFVDGALQTQARVPNAVSDGDFRKGWLFAAKCGPDVDAWEGNARFCVHPGDLPELKDTTTGLVAHIVGGFHPGSQWGSDTLPVVSIDSSTRMLETEGTAYFFMAEGSRYFLSGAPGFLDAAGEWWYDPAAEQLDYMPVDQDLTKAKVVAGVLPTFFKLDGADGMVVAGLQFREGSPMGSGKFYTDTRGFGAIRLEHADGVRLLGNIIEKVGVGIHVSESEDVVIAGNVIGDIAGNGIYLGTTYNSFGKSNRARILSNHIHDVGRIYFETAGIWFQAGDDIRIAQNLIENAAQFGIAGGSIWGQEDAVHDAVIEYNTVRNANQQTADGGAIKMMGEQRSLLTTSIRYNLVTGTGHLMNRADGSFWPPGYESVDEWPTPISWAIYTDGKASGVSIEGNTLSGNVSGIGINGGWSNLVRGNAIMQGSGAAFRVDDATAGEWHPSWARPNLIEENTVSIDRDDGLAAYVHTPNHGPGYVKFARNRYSGNLNGKSFRMYPSAMASGESGGLEDLQKAGADAGSVVARPE